MYDENCNDYLRWIVNGFDAYEKAKLDLLTFKTTKYLLYRFNDLLESTGEPIMQVNTRESSIHFFRWEDESVGTPNWRTNFSNFTQ